jgi:signal transduction histidine kinase
MRRTSLARCELTGILSDVKTMLEARRGIRSSKIVLDAPPSAFCLGDVEQLKQVFLNLGLNAIDAMPTGGTLCMRVTTEEPSWSVEDVSRCGSRVVVEFVDDGLGMTEEVKKKLFSPFFSTKPRGTGLGLSIVRKIIEAHNGSIEVESAPDHGSTFRVMLEGYQASELQVSHV